MGKRNSNLGSIWAPLLVVIAFQHILEGEGCLNLDFHLQHLELKVQVKLIFSQSSNPICAQVS